MTLPFLKDRIKEFENKSDKELLELNFNKMRFLFFPSPNPRDLPTKIDVEKRAEERLLAYADILIINNMLLERLEKK